jgi:maltooligosyltrehalose synthase
LLRSGGDIRFGARAWRDTCVAVDKPDFVNLFTSDVAACGPIKIGELLSGFPVALLVPSAIVKALDAHENVATHTILR